jgi:hypothetical protein
MQTTTFYVTSSASKTKERLQSHLRMQQPLQATLIGKAPTSLPTHAADYQAQLRRNVK